MPIARSSMGRGDVAIPPSYSTNFALTENPLSEGGKWRRGLQEGLDWTSPQTDGTSAFGTQVPHTSPPYDDSIACLQGYGPNQSASGIILNSSGVLKEVELFVHMNIGAHVVTGYELDILADGGRALLVRWNGAVSDFTPLTSASSTGVSVANGAQFLLTCVNGIIKAFCTTLSTTVPFLTYDSTGDGSQFQSGNPGMGFFASSDNGTPSGTFRWASYAAASL